MKEKKKLTTASGRPYPEYEDSMTAGPKRSCYLLPGSFPA